ncbi:MAG: carbohydrate kinase family protein [Planctomycetes bacterium]|nr:carbohydrate kinase family protein [Planctomycetota bacterium]
MKKVLFVGDINVDVIMGGLPSQPVPNKEITCGSHDVTVGSSALICASAYRFLGGRTWFAGLAGKDANGRLMLDRMRQFGIDASLVELTDKVATGVTVNLIVGHSRSQITCPGTITEYAGRKLNGRIFSRFDHVHFAGPYQQTALRPKIAGLLRAAAGAGVTTSLDPQWDVTEKWKFMKEWLPLLTWFFPNADEAISITGGRNARQACMRLAKMTACPIVKMGKDGAMVCRNGRIVSIPSYNVKIRDTTGAGDNLDAGVLYAILEKRMDVIEAVRFGIAAGARSCQFAGGVGARSTCKDIIRFMKEHAKK